MASVRLQHSQSVVQIGDGGAYHWRGEPYLTLASLGATMWWPRIRGEVRFRCQSPEAPYEELRDVRGRAVVDRIGRDARSPDLVAGAWLRPISWYFTLLPGSAYPRA